MGIIKILEAKTKGAFVFCWFCVDHQLVSNPVAGGLSTQLLKQLKRLGILASRSCADPPQEHTELFDGGLGLA